MDRSELERRAREITWYHSIELGQGVVTRGQSTNRIPPEHLVDVSGKTVLDIGAWDGLYSFDAERRGASRVVALDHYAWCLDWAARDAYWQACQERGELPDHTRDQSEFWLPEEMPGRAGFDFAHKVLASKVEAVVGDFMTIDPAELGRFDVVNFLGVLYHIPEPLTALQRVRALTAGVAVVETEAIHIDGLDDESLTAFYPGGELNADFGNWYAPSVAALVGMCRAAGFSRVEVQSSPPSSVGPAAQPPPPLLGRLRRSLRSGDWPQPARPAPEVRRYRALVHAVV